MEIPIEGDARSIHAIENERMLSSLLFVREMALALGLTQSSVATAQIFLHRMGPVLLD
jgi:hypothetical protein